MWWNDARRCQRWPSLAWILLCRDGRATWLYEGAGDERDEGRSGRELLEHIAGEIGHEDPATVVDAGRDIMEQLRRHDVVLGTRRTAQPGETEGE